MNLRQQSQVFHEKRYVTWVLYSTDGDDACVAKSLSGSHREASEDHYSSAFC